MAIKDWYSMNTARKKTYLVHDLAASLSWYLNFMSTIGRDYVIDEKTLKIPITEYLESSNIESIKLEDSHPNFKGRSVDLTFNDVERKKRIAFEFKFLKGTSVGKTDERERIFADLLRLHFFASSNNQKAYFLMCGDKMRFNSTFVTQQRINIFFKNSKTTGFKNPKPIGFFTEWFKFEVNEATKGNGIAKIDINTGVLDYKNIYNRVINEYKKDFVGKFSPLTKIETKCIYLSPENVDRRLLRTTRVGVWEVNFK